MFQEANERLLRLCSTLMRAGVMQASIVQAGSDALQSMCTCDGSHDTTSTAAGKAATGGPQRYGQAGSAEPYKFASCHGCRSGAQRVDVTHCSGVDIIVENVTDMQLARQQGRAGTDCLACLLHYNLIVRKGHEDELLDGTLLMADHFTIERVFCNGTCT